MALHWLVVDDLMWWALKRDRIFRDYTHERHYDDDTLKWFDRGLSYDFNLSNKNNAVSPVPADWTSNTRTCKYIQVLVEICYIFPSMSTRCIAAVCSKTKDVVSLVRSDVFASAYSKHIEMHALRIQNTLYTFWHEEKRSFLKHDAIPTICPASGEVEEGTWKT